MIKQVHTIEIGMSDICRILKDYVTLSYDCEIKNVLVRDGDDESTPEEYNDSSDGDESFRMVFTVTAKSTKTKVKASRRSMVKQIVEPRKIDLAL